MRLDVRTIGRFGATPRPPGGGVLPGETDSGDDIRNVVVRRAGQPIRSRCGSQFARAAPGCAGPAGADQGGVQSIRSTARGEVRCAPGRARRGCGRDAAGLVEAAGTGASLSTVGNQICRAGDLIRAGANRIVDEQIVGTKPRMLDLARAAVLSLTSLTASQRLLTVSTRPAANCSRAHAPCHQRRRWCGLDADPGCASAARAGF